MKIFKEKEIDKEELQKAYKLLNKVIDSNGFYALGTELMNDLINWRQGLSSNKPCKNCKCSKS